MTLAVGNNDLERADAGSSIEFRTLTGTSEQIGKELGKEQKILALVSSDEKSFQALIAAFELLAPSLNRLVEERQYKVLEDMFRALLPPLAPTPEMMTEAKMKLAARQAVMNDEGWLPAAKISEIAGFSDANSSTHPNRWKKSGQIFAINYNGNDYYPFYALDPDQNFRPSKALKGILDVLRQTKDDWGIAMWFASHNSFLDGQRPQDLLLSASGRVLDAARDEVVGIVHG